MSSTSRWQERVKLAQSQIEKLLLELSLEEKVSLCHAAGKFCNHGVERLGVPALMMSDGPHGVRQELNMHSWDPVACNTDTTTYLPVGTVTAATWNRDLGRAFGEVLGSESRARGKDVILGPGFNIIRDPLCGRNFEYYSEDPYLIAALNPGVIRGIQDQDTAACAKHFALNNQELNRMAYSAEPDERTLREVYLPGFEAAVKEGQVLTVMGSYNKYKGQWCCHNKELLKDILKKEWGFEGLVVSDWDGCHVSEEAAMNGLDIEMGTTAKRYEDYHWPMPFWRAYEPDGIR
ncbi:MAG: glycoside hydrolase family 3 protein [Blastochloris sp.]|nr:glycoside hydrolase family 3 protein [Blastochloris sp.]